LQALLDAVLDQVVAAGRGSARSRSSNVVMSANQVRKKGITGALDFNTIQSQAGH
jgi:hypothetical protein